MEIIENEKVKGGKVFLHCHQGVSRSISFAVMYVMFIQDVSFSSALSFVKEKRGVASPNSGFFFFFF